MYQLSYAGRLLYVFAGNASLGAHIGWSLMFRGQFCRGLSNCPGRAWSLR